MRRLSARAVAPLVLAMILMISACVSDTTPVSETPGEGVEVAMARANWSTGDFQASVTWILLEELGYIVTDSSANEIAPVDFYPSLAQGKYDLRVNGWMPNHFSFLSEVLDTGAIVESSVSTVGDIVPAGAFRDFFIDAETAGENRGVVDLWLDFAREAVPS